MELRRKRFDRPDAVRSVEEARIELVELGELAVGRTDFVWLKFELRGLDRRRRLAALVR